MLFSTRITGDTNDAESFEIDVTEVQELKIKMTGYWETFHFECRQVVVGSKMFLT